MILREAYVRNIAAMLLLAHLEYIQLNIRTLNEEKEKPFAT
jgi:hypothetical protein